MHPSAQLRMPLRDRVRCQALASQSLLQLYWQRREHPLKLLRVARPGDDVVIDGFPRSSGTFAAHAFFLTQGDGVKLGNHVHSAGQFVLAQRYRITSDAGSARYCEGYSVADGIRHTLYARSCVQPVYPAAPEHA